MREIKSYFENTLTGRFLIPSIIFFTFLFTISNSKISALEKKTELSKTSVSSHKSSESDNLVFILESKEDSQEDSKAKVELLSLSSFAISRRDGCHNVSAPIDITERKNATQPRKKLRIWNCVFRI